MNRQAVADYLKRVFGQDVEWAQHPDPMTHEDWLNLADGAIQAASSVSDSMSSDEPPSVSHE